MEAARELFVREGFENVSMRKIAEKIEYSPTTIYLYFQDKADLLDCIVEATLVGLQDKLAAVRQGIDHLSDLKMGLRAYIEFWVEHPNDFRVAFMTDLRALDPNRAWRCLTVGREIYSTLRSRLQDCLAEGCLEFGDLELASQSIWAAIYGLVCLLIMKPTFPWVDQSRLIDTVVNSAVGSMVPEHQRDRAVPVG